MASTKAPAEFHLESGPRLARFAPQADGTVRVMHVDGGWRRPELVLGVEAARAHYALLLRRGWTRF